jgi:hypothetical protein
MSKLYLEGILPILQSTCAEFVRLCQEYDVPYIIVEDTPARQVYHLGKKDDSIVKAIKEYGENNHVTVKDDGQDISILADRNSPKKCYIAVIDDDIQSKMMEAVVHYMGTRHNQLINESFKELEVPTRMVDTEGLWQTHMDHPRWQELGDRQNMYVDLQADYPPIVTDSVIQDPIKHSGVLVDGFRRLYRAHANREPQIETMDIADIITEYKNRIGLNEDQYKSPTRKLIRKQSSHPSSFAPSKSFGGIDGYGKYSKKKMEECYQGEIGKISKDLLAHDNKTIIPAGAVVRVVDGDEGLPDVWYDGQIINVDRSKLEEVWKPTSFANQLDTIIMSEEESKPKIAPEGSELEDKISSALGGTISIVEPEILFTILPKRSGNA